MRGTGNVVRSKNSGLAAWSYWATNRFSRNSVMSVANGHISKTPNVLKAVLKMANVIAAESPQLSVSRKPTMPANSQGMISNAAVAVKRLNKTCALATRRALGVAPKLANTAVTVVPMLAPITTAAAPFKSIRPV